IFTRTISAVSRESTASIGWCHLDPSWSASAVPMRTKRFGYAASIESFQGRIRSVRYFGETMAVRAVLLLCLILLVLPVFSDGPPGHSEDQPEFYFTRLMYTDTRGRGPRPGQAMPTTDFEHGHGLGDQLAWFFGAWMTDTWDADYQFMWGV